MTNLTLQEYQFHDMKLTWLRGADKLTDAGTLFGPVPKVVWSRYYPTNEDNMMAELTDPILIQYKEKNYLIDTSFDTAKLSEKQRRNLGILSESRVEESLELLGLTTSQIDIVLMTHMHHDHSGGLTYRDVSGDLVSKYPKAKIIVNDVEWYEMRNPNNRTKGTYLRENWEPIEKQVTTFSEYINVIPEIQMIRTSGHSNGHSIILLKQGKDTMIHMGDLMLTHVHRNSLWVPAVDDYPMKSILAKEKWLRQAFENDYKFFFYHDQFLAVAQFDKEGKEFVDYVPRSRPPIIPFTDRQDRKPIFLG